MNESSKQADYRQDTYAPYRKEAFYCLFVDGVIAIKDVFTAMRAEIHKGFDPLEIERASTVGIKWAVPGGEAEALGIKSSLCVDGIENVKNVLEQIATSRKRLSPSL